MLSLVDLTASYGIPVVFYDQLGVGNSTYLPDKPPLVLDAQSYLSKSWRTCSGICTSMSSIFSDTAGEAMLAAQFAATRSPRGLKKLVISNSPASQRMWTKCLNDLVRALPNDVQETLQKHEEARTFTHQDYRDALNIYYSRHMCRLPSLPDELVQTFGSIGPKSNVLFSMYVMCTLPYSAYR